LRSLGETGVPRQRVTESCADGTIIVIIMNLWNCRFSVKAARSLCFCGNPDPSCDSNSADRFKTCYNHSNFGSATMVGHSTMDCHVRHGCANGRARIPGVALDRAKP